MTARNIVHQLGELQNIFPYPGTTCNVDTHTSYLYRNLGDEMFDDVNFKTGVGPVTRRLMAWAYVFLL